MNTNTNLQNTNIRFDPDELSGRRVLVTGGTKGMGEAIVERVSQAGAKAVTTARPKPKDSLSPEMIIESDISTTAGVAKVAREIIDRFGGLDILFNNANKIFSRKLR